MLHNTPASRRTAAELARDVKLKPAARALLDDELSPRGYFERLVAHQELAAAIRFLPYALPKRAAVWWGALCLWHASRPEPGAAEASALEAVLPWLQAPTEANRRHAEAVARALGAGSAAGALAFAAFWSGGSMSRPGAPEVMPPPTLAARLVGTSVLFSAVLREPLRFRARYLDFLALGRDVAAGMNRWTEPEPAMPLAAVQE